MKILTKTLPATNTKGTRVRAAGGGRQVTLAWDYSLSHDLNHARAASALGGAGNFPGLLEEVGASRTGGIKWSLTAKPPVHEGLTLEESQ